MGPYTVSGTDVDSLGNTGTWTYTLTVTHHTVTQELAEDGQRDSGQSLHRPADHERREPGDLRRHHGLPGLLRLSSGAVSARDTLAVGSYTVSGTDTDNLGNTGTWTYTLTVNPHTVTQGSPKTGSVTQGNPFTDQLSTNGASPVTYAVTTVSPAFSVSSSGCGLRPRHPCRGLLHRLGHGH